VVLILVPVILVLFTVRVLVMWVLSPQDDASSGCGWWNGLQLWRVAANILNKQPQTKRHGVVLQLEG
jgi:hypothetical protein